MQIRITIFEDNRKLRESLRQLIDNTEDMLCAGAFADANHLHRHMQLTKPNVVVMDIQMPGVSGIEAVQAIRAGFPEVRILMQTVFEDDNKIFAAICAGAAGYLLKKTSPQKMIEAIRETYDGGGPMTPIVATRVLDLLRTQQVNKKSEAIFLSPREKEIVMHLVDGKTNKEIAFACSISADTVGTHVRHIYEKLQVHSKSEAVAKAIFQKLF